MGHVSFCALNFLKTWDVSMHVNYLGILTKNVQNKTLPTTIIIHICLLSFWSLTTALVCISLQHAKAKCA